MIGIWQVAFATMFIAAGLFAYLRPSPFRRLYGPLMLIVLSGALLCYSYSLGNSVGYGQAISTVHRENPGTPFSYHSRERAPFWIFASPIVLCTWLIILRHTLCSQSRGRSRRRKHAYEPGQRSRALNIGGVH